ncbi:MAG: DeoR/GlpR family DNA-binding transcription regulator [Thermotogota bacterium]|nr:DeoR/GlpR family DNA-binding transcription regulator [Thermotogota bacterium]
MKILDYLKKHTSLTTRKLSKLLNVSENTIRRDLRFLDNQGLINRDRNGAMISTFHPETNFLLNLKKMKDEKTIIAKKAINIIKEGELIAFSGGTTTYSVATELENVPLTDLTIITNTVNIAQYLLDSRKHFKVILTGGIPREGFYECTGIIAERVVKQFNIDKFFMGVNGISEQGGFSFFDLEEAEIAQTFLQQSKETYVVADSSKYDLTQKTKVADFTDVKGVISEQVPEKYKKLFQDNRVVVL